MIITSKFVFIHMHKTGGQSLGHMIEQCIPGFQHIGYHYPYHLLPSQYSDLPVVGMVRNPWDWYISWYAFNTRPNARNPLFFIISNGFQADFKQTVINLINLGSDKPASQYHREALIGMFPETLDGNQGVGLTKDCIYGFNDNDNGYYSWLFSRMHGDIHSDTTYIGRFENLQEEFLSIMEKLSVEELDAIRTKFINSPRLNESKHSHYSLYYDDELRELVAEKEAVLITKYNYQFEDSPPSKRIIEFPNIQIGGIKDSFQKLSGKANNFNLMFPDFDVDPIRNIIAQIPLPEWEHSGRENVYEAHRETQALQLIYDSDFRHFNPTYHELYSQFEEALKPLIDFIADYFQHNGFVARLIFAKLRAGGKIAPHTDGLYSLLKCHRIHIPIITNDKVIFMIGGEEKVLHTGEMWEINNATVHAVDNQSEEDRIHLIIDWVPRSTVRPEDKNPGLIASAQANPSMPTYNGQVVGRNKPCPCNSGKKFKRCHGAVI
ncbi:MAG: aspartyl/asparaginyl beta-hydroxylase domain-containing protein [Gammaproteobacteria bacterium]|nr:aspartyl/asparaginyl beta-hydroxylase domain-containing protein [Gammaproteobacteria bacterium]